MTQKKSQRQDAGGDTPRRDPVTTIALFGVVVAALFAIYTITLLHGIRSETRDLRSEIQNLSYSVSQNSEAIFHIDEHLGISGQSLTDVHAKLDSLLEETSAP